MLYAWSQLADIILCNSAALNAYPFLLGSQASWLPLFSLPLHLQHSRISLFHELCNFSVLVSLAFFTASSCNSLGDTVPPSSSSSLSSECYERGTAQARQPSSESLFTYKCLCHRHPLHIPLPAPSIHILVPEITTCPLRECFREVSHLRMAPHGSVPSNRTVECWEQREAPW